MRSPSMQFNTLAGVGLVGALAGAAGSFVTALLAISIIWALVLLSVKRIPLKFQRSDLWIAGPAIFFVLATTASALFGWRAGQSEVAVLKRLAPLLAFLFFPLILARLRTVEHAKLVDTFILGCAVCGLLALPLAIIQVGWYDVRAEGGAGNAIPFAMVCSFFGSLSLLNLLQQARWRQVLGLVGFAAAMVCLLLSRSRGLIPVPFIAVVMFLVMFPEQRARLRDGRALTLLLGLLAVLLAVASTQMDRLWLLIRSVFDLDPGAADQSTALRLEMWEHATRLISERPFWGYGLQNRRALMSEIDLGYSHFHNGFLTTLVDSGAFGLFAVALLVMAPVLCVFVNPSKACWKARLFIALMIATTYIVGGLTNFIFLHDIYDSVFLWSALIVAAPWAGEDRQCGAPRARAGAPLATVEDPRAKALGDVPQRGDQRPKP